MRSLERLLSQQHQISILHILLSRSHKGWFVVFATSTAGNSKLVWFTCADLQHKFSARPLCLLSVLLHSRTTESLTPQLSLSPISLQICGRRTITHVGVIKARLCMKLCTQTPDFPELLLLVSLAFACPPPACPELHCDEALNYMVTWKASHKSRVSHSVPKMAGAYSMWTFHTFFSLLTFTVILLNDLLSLLQKHNQLAYGSLHCSAHEFSLTKHAFFNTILRHQKYYWYLMTKTR